MGSSLLLGSHLLVGLGLALFSFLWEWKQLPRGYRTLTRLAHRFARQRGRVILLVFLLAFGFSALRGALHGLPIPYIQDEFNYILAADTFRQGKLTNPTHPHWVFFESAHTIHIPSYMGKYPPGQGLILALGWWLFGHPIFGVWLSFALACAGVAWMLQQYFRPVWGLYGGLLTLFVWGVWYWNFTFWGGGLAAFGSALIFGSFRRLWDRPTWFQGMILGLGLGILAMTRPFEGLVAVLPVGAALIYRVVVPGRGGRSPLLKGLAGTVLALAALGTWLGFYHYRVTGNPFKMPYQVHDEQYVANPTFFFQPLSDKIPAYRHKVLEDYWVGWEREYFKKHNQGGGINLYWLVKLYAFLIFAVGPWLILPWLAFLIGNRNTWFRFVFLVIVLECFAFSQILYFLGHYAAPIFGPLVLVPVQGLRLLATRSWHGIRPWRCFVVLLPLVVGVFFVIDLVWNPHLPFAWAQERDRIQKELVRRGGEHVVFVKYGPLHYVQFEWVYNGADIDGQPVVFAHDMGPSENRKLLDYYPHRRAWLLEVEAVYNVPGFKTGEIRTLRIQPHPR